LSNFIQAVVHGVWVRRIEVILTHVWGSESDDFYASSSWAASVVDHRIQI